MDEPHARARLARVPGLTAAELRALHEAAGGTLAGTLQRRTWQRVPLGDAVRAALAAKDDQAAAEDLGWLAANDVRILLACDSDYPAQLAASAAAPAALYVAGSVAALATPQLAMVGSRHPTTSGRDTARAFATWFARAGLTVTSGLAAGIDAASHEGALAGGGLTVAVCGTALDRVYPEEHAPLAARIRRAHGALVSEIPPRTDLQREHFQRRNRIISALSLGTLVVEATRDSGALSTARLAGEQGREVFAIPGSIHSPLSHGCHQLIREGAKLVEQAADVMTELRISVPAEPLTAPPESPAHLPELDKEYEMLLDALGLEGASIENLVARTQLRGESVASMLLILELQGRVVSLPGGRYGRTP